MMSIYHSSFWIGLLLCLLGCLSGAIGDTLVRSAHTKPSKHVYHIYLNPAWWAGILFAAVGNTACTAFALSMVPLNIVTSFAGLHIFFAILFSKIWLNEHLSLIEVIGAFIQAFGILILVHTSSTKTFDDILEVKGYLLSVPGITFFSLDSFLVIFSLIILVKYFNNLTSISSLRRLSLPIASGSMGGITNALTKGVSLGFGTLSTKSFKTGEKPFYVTICILSILSALLQGYLWNTSLKYGSAGFVVTIINSTLIITGAIGSILVFEEIPQSYCFFVTGSIILLSGMLILFIGGKSPSNLEQSQPDQYQSLT